MKVTLAQFKKQLTKRAEMLRRHNMLSSGGFTQYVHPRTRRRMEKVAREKAIAADLFDEV